MALAMILRAKQEKLPLPAAIAPGTPWSDLTETGDTYKTNEWLDYVLVSYSGYLSHAAKLYAKQFGILPRPGEQSRIMSCLKGGLRHSMLADANHQAW